MVVHIWNPSPLEVEVGGSGDQSQPWLQGIFEASLKRLRNYLAGPERTLGQRSGPEGKGT